MDFDAAIFDLDGTLIDSMPVWDAAWETFCDRYASRRDESAYSRYKTLTLVSACEYYREYFHIDKSVSELCDEVNGIVRLGYATVDTKPGVPELLRRLSSNGTRLCVATNTARYLVEYVMERHDILRYFDFILPCAEFGSGKDRPEIFLECARRLGSAPERTAVFEDAPHALATAKGAGFRTVAVFDRSYAADEGKIRQVADVYIKSFSEL